METSPHRSNWQRLAGIFLLSMATLLLELSLTRVLSVALWYHFGFLIISTALLGFGTSGVVISVWEGLRESARLDKPVFTLSILFSVSILVSFWLMQRIPFDPFSVLTDARQLVFAPLFYLTTCAPFFFAGLILSLLFSRVSSQIGTLYAFDLFGAGAGCASIAVVMPVFGGSGSVVFASAIGLLAAAVFGIVYKPRASVAVLALSAMLMVFAAQADRILPIRPNSVKAPYPFPAIFTAWNTFSKIDVIERPAMPEKGMPAMRRFIYDGGTAATGCEDLRPGVSEYLAAHRLDTDYPSGIAYLGKPQPKVLVIGSGGGAEVLDALHFGSKAVTAVEINPIIASAVKDKMNDFWGGMFRRPEVALVVEDGRSFVRRTSERFDAIISVHTISNAAVSSGALSLSENYVLTREAFSDYLDHLTDDGMIYFTRPETHIAKLFATARVALEERHVSDIPSHFFAYRVPPDDWEKERFGVNRPAFEAGFLLKKSPFTREEQRRIEEFLGVGEAPRDRRPSPETLYSIANPGATPILNTILTTQNLPAFYSTQVRQYEPATDDRPFFNHHTRWSSLSLQTVKELLTHKKLGMLMLGDQPIAEISLLVLLGQTAILAAIMILMPLRRFFRQGIVVKRWPGLICYFAALGFGFILVEMALLSRFTLFLGQPVYTYAVVLASLLCFTGLGAQLSSRVTSNPRKGLAVSISFLLLALTATAVLVPIIIRTSLEKVLWMRIVIAVGSLCPLGVLLGIPFPLGLRLLSKRVPALVPWAWGVNGFFTVIGTVTAIMLAMAWGTYFVLSIGGATYLVALGGILWFTSSEEN